MTLESLAQQVADHEADTQAAHKRLRDTLVDLKDEVDHVGSEQRATAHDLDLLRRTPVDATKLILSTRAILAVVLAAVTIAASYWNLSTKIDAQQKATEATARLQEIQMKVLGDAAADAKATAADVKRQYELLRYEFQGLKDALGKRK